jgi:hypothetical protein
MAQEERISTTIGDVAGNQGLVYDPVAGLIRVSPSGRGAVPGGGRRDVELQALGILAEPFSQLAAPAAAVATLATQAVFGVSVALRRGDVVTSIGGVVTTAAAGSLPTTVRAGIANSAGMVLALTGNVNALANWALGPQLWPLTAPFTVPADGIYYLVIVKNGVFGTTEPQMLTVTTADATQGAGFTAIRRSWTWAAQVDLPAVNSPLTITAATTLQRYLAAIGTPFSG